jgi:DUF1680 family protein
MQPGPRRRTLAWLAALPAIPAVPASMFSHSAGAAESQAIQPAVQLFALNEVRVTGGPLYAAQQRNLAYLLALDPQRLLAPFRREAGLTPLGQPYKSWESQGLDGHMLGHVLSALALAVAATGNAICRQRLHFILTELQACQQAETDPLMAGYIGGIPEGAAMWRTLAAGTVNADNFSLNGRWVPWYNVHKTLAGLRDAHEYGAEPALEGAQPSLALTLLLRLTDWVERVTAPLSEAQMQTMLRTEHGGMAEVLADVHKHSGEARHAKLARRFVQLAIYAPLAERRDALTGLHANTQIPKVMGFVRVAERTLWPEGIAAAQFFWETVVNRRSTAIGGNSVKEHFHDSANFSPMLNEVEGPESCNTYNMLKLSAALFAHGGADAFLAYAERALFNHVLSAQHPRTGGLVYFTPLRAAHYRVYSQAQQGMWCCVGSGIETHSRHGELIYAHSENALWVNLFVPSVLNAKALGLRVEQHTSFPHSGQVTLTLHGMGQRALKLRHPHWAATITVKRNGRTLKLGSRSGNTPGSTPGSHFTLPGPWREGERVQLVLPLQPRLEALPAPLADGQQAHALLAGPIVLAARRPALPGDTAQQHFGDDTRMGHIAAAAQAPESATLNLADAQRLLQGLQAVPHAPLHWRTRELVVGGNSNTVPANSAVELLPFFELHESRYQVYWPDPPKQNPDAAQREREAADAQAQRALAARTIDSVAPGEQQPEVEHGYEAQGGDTGLHMGRRWRHATGWFGYTLANPQSQGRVLQLLLSRGDAGRNWALEVNGLRLPLKLRADAASDFYTVEVPLPADLLAASGGQLKLRFIALEGSVAGGLYGLRLLKD